MNRTIWLPRRSVMNRFSHQPRDRKPGGSGGGTRQSRKRAGRFWELARSANDAAQALDIFKELGDKRGMGSTMTNLSSLRLAEQGNLPGARSAWWNRPRSFIAKLDSSKEYLSILQPGQYSSAAGSSSGSEKRSEAVAGGTGNGLGNPELVAWSMSQSASLSLDENPPSDGGTAAEQAAKQGEDLKTYDLEAPRMRWSRER